MILGEHDFPAHLHASRAETYEFISQSWGSNLCESASKTYLIVSLRILVLIGSENDPPRSLKKFLALVPTAICSRGRLDWMAIRPVIKVRPVPIPVSI